MPSELEFQQYDFNLKRDRRFSAIIFSHLSRLNNYPKNKEQVNEMYDSQYESIRRIASHLDYPPISDGQIESLRHENAITNSRQYIDQKAPLWGALLTNIITGFKSTNILEIGTFTGLTSAYIAKRNPNAFVTSCDIDEKLVDVANKNFNALQLENVKAIHSDYRSLDLNDYEVIFKDGLHHGQANLDLADYLAKLSATDNKPRLLVLDDVRWSWDMMQAWRKLKKKTYVKATIDCYHIGALLIAPSLSGDKEEFRYSLPGLLPR